MIRLLVLKPLKGGAIKVEARDVPAYDLAEAAHYLHLPKTTLRNWVFGHQTFRAVIELPYADRSVLSFVNLVEAHVLSAITRKHRLPLQRVRRAMDYLQSHFTTSHPLATHQFETDGVNLFVRELGRIINVSEQGQVAMRDLVEAHLKRIQWDKSGLPLALYPFVSPDLGIDRRAVMFNPRIQFGRLVIAGSGTPTIEVAQRYKAGESVAELVDDYDRTTLEIEDAIRCELQLEAA